MKTETMNAAKTVIRDCMMVKPEEKLLILTDAGKLELAQVFAEAGRELGCDTVLVCGPVQMGGEMPALCAAALDKADVALLITSGSFTHTRARADATARGCRIASMPTITEEIVNQTLNADFDEVERISSILTEKLTNCKKIHVTTKLGMDLTLYCQGRTGLADTGKLGHEGAFGNMPAGEAMVAPVESLGEGTIIVDGVVVGMGILEAPLTITMAGGKITGVSGKQAAQFQAFIDQFDENAKRIAEFGIGTNAKCHIMGNPLVDEKIFGTIHIACGNNLFMGGQQDSNMHYDMIINEPTVYLDDECVIRDGRHLY